MLAAGHRDHLHRAHAARAQPGVRRAAGRPSPPRSSRRPGSRPACARDRPSRSPPTPTTPPGCGRSPTTSTARASQHERLTSRECRALEPLLAPTVRSGLLVPSDWSCDNRVLLDALTTAARAGRRPRGDRASCTASRACDGRVTGATLADGTTLATDRVVLANGAWAAQVDGVPDRPRTPGQGSDRCGSTRAGSRARASPSAPSAAATRSTSSRASTAARSSSARPSRSRASTTASPPAGSTSCCATPGR